jgi:hypothetical protein
MCQGWYGRSGGFANSAVLDVPIVRTPPGKMTSMERALSEWEQGVVRALASIDDPMSPMSVKVRESLPHLVVTGMCECGCASFNVRDTRYPPQPHELEHFATGRSADGSVGFDLWLGPDGGPISIDVDNEPGVLPDPSTIVARSPSERP